MNYLKKIGKSFLYIIITLSIGTLIITLLNYFSILVGKTLTITKILILFISFFIGGIIVGKSSNKNGWLEGIKFSLISIVILFLLKGLISDSWFKIKDLIYCLIVTLSITTGSMIGINKK